MDLDDFWWQGSLAKDVYQHLFETERQQTWGTSAKCPSLRLSLVHWILKMSRNTLDSHSKPVELGNRCVHLAVMLLDFYLDWHQLNWARDYYVLAGTCLRLAAKFEESDAKVPTLQFVIGAINSAVASDYTSGTSTLRSSRPPNCTLLTAADFKRMEMSLLGFINYRLMFPTAPCFVPYFISIAFATQLPTSEADCRYVNSFEQTGYPCSVHQQGQTTDQTSIYGPSVLNQHYQYCSADTDPYGFPSCFNTPSPEPIQSYTELSTLKDHLSKMVNLLLELSLQDVGFARFRRSLLAASSVYVGRQLLGLIGWTPVLSKVTRYSATDLFSCADLLLSDLRGFLIQIQSSHNISTVAPYIQICFQAFCLTPQHIYNPLPSPPVDPSWTTAVSAPYRSTFNADSNYTGDVSRQYETPLPNYGNWQQPAGSFDGIYLPPPAKKQRNDSRMSSLPQSMSNSYDQNQRGRIPQSQMGNSQGASDSYSLTPAYPSTGTAYQPPSNPVQYQYGDSSVTSYQQPTRQQSAVLRPAPTYGVPEYHQNAPATSGPQLATNTLMFPVIMSRTQDGQQVIIVQTNGGRYVDPLAVYGNNNIYAAQQSLTAATTGYPSSMPYYSGLHPTVAGLQLGDRSCQIQSNDLFSAAIVNEWQNAPVPSASTNGTATVGKRMKRKSSANNLAGIAESLQENLNVKRLRLGEH